MKFKVNSNDWRGIVFRTNGRALARPGKDFLQVLSAGSGVCKGRKGRRTRRSLFKLKDEPSSCSPPSAENLTSFCYRYSTCSPVKTKFSFLRIKNLPLQNLSLFEYSLKSRELCIIFTTAE